MLLRRQPLKRRGTGDPTTDKRPKGESPTPHGDGFQSSEDVSYFDTERLPRSISSWDDHIYLTGRHDNDVCFIQHVPSNLFVHVTGTQVSLAPLRDPNKGLLNRRLLHGFYRGKSVEVIMVGVVKDCSETGSFLTTTQKQITVETFKEKGAIGKRLTVHDRRIFLRQRVQGSFSLFESGSNRGWYLSLYRGEITLKWVPRRHLQRDSDIFFRMHYPEEDCL